MAIVPTETILSSAEKLEKIKLNDITVSFPISDFDKSIIAINVGSEGLTSSEIVDNVIESEENSFIKN